MISLEKKLTNNDVRYVCNYINMIDRNSDIDLFYKEYLDNEVPYEVVIECFTRIMNEWMEDNFLNGFTATERYIYHMLKIDLTEIEG